MQKLVLKANDIADWFLCRVDREAGGAITHLKLQKLLYYAQAWYFTAYNKPLFREKIEAWQHGPVVREVFNRFRDSGWYSLDVPAEGCKDFGEEIESFLEEILSAYGRYDAKFLEDLTHIEDPWIEARGDLSPEQASNNEITLESMRNFYIKKYEEA